MERAYEFYSPEALRQRWNFLTGNPGFAGAIASSGGPATAAMEQRPGVASSTAAGPAKCINSLTECKDPTLQELPPLSHFSEDVRDQIKAIYAGMQSKLSSSYHDQEKEETEVFSESPESIAPEVSASGKSNGGEEVECMANELSDFSDGEDWESESELSDNLEDTAMSLFGTAELDEIIAYLSRPEAGVVFFQPGVTADCNTPIKTSYAQILDNLPSSYVDLDDEETDVLYERPCWISPDMSANGKSNSLQEVEGIANESCDFRDGHGYERESGLSDRMEDAEMSPLSTADLNEIIAYQSQPEADVVFFQPGVTAEADVNCNATRKPADQDQTVPVKTSYAQILDNLPSSYVDLDDEETDVLYERPRWISPDMSANGKSNSLQEVEGIANESCDFRDGHGYERESGLSDRMEDAEMSPLSTADLNEIIAYQSQPEADVVFFQPGVTAEADVNCNATRKPAVQADDIVPSDGESEQTYRAYRQALKDSSELRVKNISVAERDVTAIWECGATAHVSSCRVV